MGTPAKKPVIGILGGIGSGKSTVAAEFAKLGCRVIDADRIAHELLDTELVRRAVTRAFGLAVVGADGKLERTKLAEVVFSDGRKLALLNKILHPSVLHQVEQHIRNYRQEDDCPAIVLDMPLLVEVGWARRCDRLIFVDCDAEIRSARARTAEWAKTSPPQAREKFQISLDKKRDLADNTLDNNSDFSALVSQVTKIFSEIMGKGGF